MTSASSANSPSTRSIVQYGHWKRDPPIPSFPIHTVPDIKPNSIIVGVCGISDVDDANLSMDGWFVSDFYAFNYLLKGHGKQFWITALNPDEILNRWGNYLHGNSYKERKVVLSKQLINAGQLSKPIITKPTDLKSTFLQISKDCANEARQRKVPLVVFIFSHGEVDHRVLMGKNQNGDDLWVHIDEFRAAIGLAVDFTVISTACFSGGWITHKMLNATASSAAGDDGRLVYSGSWNESKSIGRYCGSIYASTLIQVLSDESSPLLRENQQLHLQGSPGSLQSSSNNAPVAKAFNEFAWTVQETLAQRIDRTWNMHEFHFSAQNDEWETSWTGRTGLPLVQYGERWAKLESKAPDPKYSETLANQNPRIQLNPGSPESMQASLNTSLRETAPGEVFRFRASQIKRLANELLKVCPGIGSDGFNSRFRSPLIKFVNKPDDEITPGDLLQMTCYIAWRNDQLTWADKIVNYLGIPQPDNRPIRSWQRWESPSNALQKDLTLKNKMDITYKKLQESKIFDAPPPGLGPPWTVTHHYLTQALAVAFKKEAEIAERISQIVECKRLYAELYSDG
jgi:hypothetical protein